MSKAYRQGNNQELDDSCEQGREVERGQAHGHGHGRGHEHESSEEEREHTHGCGHNNSIHEHEHEHAHHHEHEHVHHHDQVKRDSFELAQASIALEAHTHEQAATVSLRIRPKSGETVPFEIIVDAVRTIAANAEAAGGIIGHVKAFAREGDAFARVSATAADLPLDCKGALDVRFGKSANIQLVAIVLLIDLDQLASICKSAF